MRSGRQAKGADGCFGVNLRRSGGAFWTVTLWRDAAAMRAFMLSGAHAKAMPKLARWCDEASVTHWEQDGRIPPTWAEAEGHLAAAGRTSRVDFPSPAHAAGKTLGTLART